MTCPMTRGSSGRAGSPQRQHTDSSLKHLDSEPAMRRATGLELMQRAARACSSEGTTAFEAGSKDHAGLCGTAPGLMILTLSGAVLLGLEGEPPGTLSRAFPQRGALAQGH
jgi:hypothetical protein